MGDLNEESQGKLLRYLATLQSGGDYPSSEYEAREPDWQIILTTRRLIPELRPYVKEEISRPDRMLLRKR